MGFLDRIASLVRRAETGQADPKGPLGLMPGDEISYYRERFRVTGIRILLEPAAHVFQYRLQGEGGGAAVLSARTVDTSTWMMERVATDLAVDWKAERLKGPEGDEFTLAAGGKCATRTFGDAGFEGSQGVAFRRYVDEDEEQTIVLEDHGVAREVRVADPVFEGELRFEKDAGVAEDRPWAVAGDDDDDDDAAAEIDDDARVQRGSTVAAALALEGRFVSDVAGRAEAFPDTDPFEYADEEWADARDAVPDPQALQGSADAPNDPLAEWLTPTFWVAGSSEAPAAEAEDDWLVKQG